MTSSHAKTDFKPLVTTIARHTFTKEQLNQLTFM